jgi:hypothetical protein
MPMYDADSGTFDPSLIPSYLKKEVREIIEVAVAFGWKMHISSDSSVTIIAPEERKKYHFSATGRASNSLNRIRKDAIRFGDPEKVLLADSILGIKDPEVARMAATLLPSVSETTVVDHRPELESETKPTPAVMPKKKPSSDSEPERRIVSEKPMMAKASEGKGYESRVAIERTWSDGSIDYKCVDCDFTTPNRLGVRGHRSTAGHVKRGADGKRIATEVPNAAVYRPRQSRVQALATIIEELMTGGETDPQAIALQALTWVHEQSRKGTALADEREPMTAEETLERIKTLLDNGEGLAQKERIATLEKRVDEAEQWAVEAEARADAAVARADAIKQQFDSFIELANELRQGA